MSVGKSIQRDKVTGKAKFLASEKKVIATCGFPQRITLTFSDIHEVVGFSCGYGFENNCNTPPWVNPNRTFILNKIIDANGVIAYECNSDATFYVKFIMQYVTWDNGSLYYRYILVYLYRKTSIPKCICPLFMAGWEHIWEEPFIDIWHPIRDNRRFIKGQTGYSENTSEQYVCIKNRRAWTDYGTWFGYNPSDWLDNHQYYAGDLVWGTDTKLYRCAKNHISSPDRRPITGQYYGSYWSVVEYTYRHGVDVVTGTDGKKYYCKGIHTSSDYSKPITGSGWSLYWGQCPADWDSNTTYNWLQTAVYENNIVQSRRSGNIGHVPDVNNNSCDYDYWWQVVPGHNFTTWSSGRLYSGGGDNSRVKGTDDKGYKCIKAHHSHPDTKPITGSQWQDYWEFEYKKNTPEIDPDWKEYWTKIKCDTPFEEGRFLINEQMSEYVVGTWGRVVFSTDIPNFDVWQHGLEYKIGDMVVGDDNHVYACEVSHTSSYNNKPVSGSEWDDYWIQAGCTQ